VVLVNRLTQKELQAVTRWARDSDSSSILVILIKISSPLSGRTLTLQLLVWICTETKKKKPNNERNIKIDFFKERRIVDTYLDHHTGRVRGYLLASLNPINYNSKPKLLHTTVTACKHSLGDDSPNLVHFLTQINWQSLFDVSNLNIKLSRLCQANFEALIFSLASCRFIRIQHSMECSMGWNFKPAQTNVHQWMMVPRLKNVCYVPRWLHVIFIYYIFATNKQTYSSARMAPKKTTKSFHGYLWRFQFALDKSNLCQMHKHKAKNIFERL